MAPDLTGRGVTGSASNRVWLADLTCVRIAEGWLYFAVVLDLVSRRVAGWAMADHPGHELALAALDMAIAYERSAPGLMHHSDRGVQLAAHDYRKRSLQDGLIYSMSRKGDCWDDALDGELVALCDYFMRDEARTDVFQSVEGFHNRRRHSGIGYPTPEQMAVACQAAALAA